MTPTQTKPEEKSAAKPRPGFWEQAIVTLKVLLAIGAVLGGIWLLDALAVS
ncbi:MAG: hypothetical protein LAP40_06800 [Acidobacteriia bacterium]|nr:hypothetical protein [Terriglobia bacterium]